MMLRSLTTGAIVFFSVSVTNGAFLVIPISHGLPSPSCQPQTQGILFTRSCQGSTKASAGRGLGALYASNMPSSKENSMSLGVASLSLRTMALALFVATIGTFATKPLSASAVRLSTAAITLVDFAPTVDTQWKNTSLAVEIDQSPGVRKFWKLVRFKTIGELVGLGVMLASGNLACLGASLIMLSHILFWIGGGGSSQVDATGIAAPLPPALVKTIFAADVTLLVASIVGTVASPPKIRAAGAYLYSAIVGALCTEKLKAALPKQREQYTGKKANTTEAVSPESSESTISLENENHNSTASWNFDWRTNWYPLAFTKVTAKDVPHRLELMGEHLVLWHDGTQWAALADECPHRLAPLSEGRIDEEGQIECPYHGWTFTSQGTCTKIPQSLPNRTIYGTCRARSFRIVEKQGIIWAWGRVGATEEEADESLLPLCPPIDDDRFVYIDFSRDLPYSADMLLENVLDPAHVPFTHHKTISSRDAAKPLPLSLTTPITAKGLEGERKSDVPIGKMGEENAKGGIVTKRTTSFVAPTYMYNTIRSASVKDKDFDKGRESWTVVYATPTGPGRSRLLARFPFRFPPPKRRFLVNIPVLIFKYLPDWVNHMGQLKVTDDDNIFLPIQERRTQDVGGWTRYKLPTDADAYVRGYRRWFDRAGPPPYSPFAFDELRASTPTRAQLLDRKSQHTEHCSSCRGALKNAGRARVAMRALLIACTAVAPSLVFQRAYKSLAAVALAAGIASQVRRAALFVENSLTTGLMDYPPPRNRPEMKGRAQELRTVEEGRKF